VVLKRCSSSDLNKMNVIEQVDMDQKPEDSEQSEESKNSTEYGKMYIVG
jgi:hypothetical protein